MIINKQLTVSEFSFYVSKIFENETLLHNIDIVGEVAEFNIRKGIAYFQIKDINSVLSCVMFDAISKYNPKIGEKIVVSGSPNYYAKGGKFSFNCTKITPFGLGDIYKQFELMKQKLSKEGLFDIEHKKRQPDYIKKIGVVTSKQGAVIQDIINVATRRDSTITIVLYPVKVQGIGAELEISKGIDFFNNYDVDAVIVARGGGSKEDLLPFNTEIVARSTYNCNKYIVSAVGHEIDFTIIDYVADTRVPTPSAAAEILTKDFSIIKENFKHNLYLLQSTFENVLYNNMKNINNELIYLNSSYASNIDKYYNQNLKLIENLTNNYKNNIEKMITQIEKDTEILSLSNPQNILKNGYAKIEKDNKGIASINDLSLNDSVSIVFIDGTVVAKVEKLGGNNGEN